MFLALNFQHRAKRLKQKKEQKYNVSHTIPYNNIILCSSTYSFPQQTKYGYVLRTYFVFIKIGIYDMSFGLFVLFNVLLPPRVPRRK